MSKSPCDGVATSPHEKILLKSSDQSNDRVITASPIVELTVGTTEEINYENTLPISLKESFETENPSEKLWKIKMTWEMVFGLHPDITFKRCRRPGDSDKSKGFARIGSLSPGLRELGLKPGMHLLMIGKKNVSLCDYDEQNEIIKRQLELKDREQMVTFCEASPFHHWIPGTPYVLGIRIEIRGITTIDTVHQNFNCRLVLKFVWQPSRLEIEQYVKEESWNRRNWRPRFEFPNAQEFTRRQYQELVTFDEYGCTRSNKGPENYILINNGETNPKGFTDKMTVDCIFMGSIEVNAAFAEQLELRMFPFDTQDLTISIWSDTNTGEMQFIPYGNFFAYPMELVTVSTSYCSITNEWDIFEPIVDIENDFFSTIHVRNKVTRRPNVFVWRMMIPLSLISAAAVFSFFLDLSAGGERIAYAFTAVLTSVVFQMKIYGDLPDITYMTLLDWYVLILFLFMLGIVLDTGVFTMLFHDCSDEDEQEAVRDLDGMLAYIFCGVFVLLHVAFYVLVKVGQGKEVRKLDMNGRDLENSMGIGGSKPWKKVKTLYQTVYDSKYKWTESYTTKNKADHLKRVDI